MRGRATCCSGGTPVYFSAFVEGRRGELLDAALCVFAEKGYEGGTMRQIGARLGVTEPALYRHYPSKEALYEDLVALAGDRLVAQAGTILDAVRPETLRESLGELIRMRRRPPLHEGIRPILGTLLMAAPHNAAFLETFRAHVARPMVAELERLVPRVDAFYGIERTPEQTASSLRAFMSLFVGYFMTAMVFGQPDDDEAIVDAMLAIMGWSGRSGTGLRPGTGGPACARP